MCSICQMNITEDEADNTIKCKACLNPFHSTCLLQNASHGNNECPLCKHELFPKREEPPRYTFVHRPQTETVLIHMYEHGTPANKRKVTAFRNRKERIKKKVKEYTKIKKQYRREQAKHCRETNKMVMNLRRKRYKEWRTEHAEDNKKRVNMKNAIERLYTADGKAREELTQAYLMDVYRRDDLVLTSA